MRKKLGKEAYEDTIKQIISNRLRWGQTLLADEKKFLQDRPEVTSQFLSRYPGLTSHLGEC